MSNIDDDHAGYASGPDLRFNCTSADRVKRKAKLLKRKLAAHGFDFRLSKCHDLVAQMYGFTDLRDLYEHLALFGRSPGDEDVDQETFERRFGFQIEKLVEIGVPGDIAEQVIDHVRPTGGGTQPHVGEPNVRGNDPVDLRAWGYRN